MVSSFTVVCFGSSSLSSRDRLVRMRRAIWTLFTELGDILSEFRVVPSKELRYFEKSLVRTLICE